ncbi:MAG: molybdate ABC transporter substrate-binding protein [Acidobacteria bacterium]|nr:molybdate ABC transporter substrate-binding protein [Acidobacteriota bacterium]
MRLLVALFCLLAALPAGGVEIRVAAASDLNFAIKEIIAEFERQTGYKVLLTLGSSGNFFAQISNGAPFEVFLSADLIYPEQLEARGLAAPGSTFTYGAGRIALWSRTIDVSRGMESLLAPSIRKIAIANPKHAPYGRAAVSAMRKANVYQHVKEKIVLGENISQAAQFVQSGAADVGIIALSLALADPMKSAGKHWVVPGEELQQGAIILKRAGPAAREFFEWLRGPSARKIFEKYGFQSTAANDGVSVLGGHRPPLQTKGFFL